MDELLDHQVKEETKRIGLEGLAENYRLSTIAVVLIFFFMPAALILGIILKVKEREMKMEFEKDPNRYFTDTAHLLSNLNTRANACIMVPSLIFTMYAIVIIMSSI